MRQTAARLVEYHLSHKTPLFQLGNAVRWLEAKKEKAKADQLRLAISRIFARRFVAGEYDEAEAR